MMRMLIVLVIAALSARAEKFVYSPDGTNVVCAPRELPSVGVIRGTDRAVLNLLGASDAKRAACGWYSVSDTCVKPEGCHVTGSAWRIEGTSAIRTYTFAPIADTGYEVSKYRIIDQLDALGKLDGFLALINADGKLRARWDAAVVLDSTNALVVQAKAAMTSTLGLSANDVERIMKNARVK